MPRLLLAAAVTAMYVLHQDVWFWREARPLVFGFLPVGLAYHAAYCVAVAALMWWLTRVAWPAHLELEPASPSSDPSIGTAARPRRNDTTEGRRR